VRLAEMDLASAWTQVQLIADGHDVQLTRDQARLLVQERARFRRDRQCVAEARKALDRVSREEV
jgi:hypothetical protein